MTPYTDATFADYLHSLIVRGKFATVLGWTVAEGAYAEIIQDTVLGLGGAAIPTYTADADVQRLRIAGQVMLYRAVLTALITSYDISIEGNSFSRSQMLNGAKLALTMAESSAEALGLDLPASGIGTVVVPNAPISAVSGSRDPYRLPPIWARELPGS